MTRISIAITALIFLAACSENVSPRAERVFYRGDGGASWGTVCKLNKRGWLGLGERGYVSVAHVTDNGTPLVGPKDAVTAANQLSDWSFLGIDPAQLDANDYPAMKAGTAVEIHGFPARDRDGEVVPGVLYLDDPVPPFWWIELHDSDDGIAAEGVIGGFSGSCVLDMAGNLVAVVHANGFSHIGGTTNTFARVVPIRDAILQAQGNSRTNPPATLTASTNVATPLTSAHPAITANAATVSETPVYLESAPSHAQTAAPLSEHPVSPAQASEPFYIDIGEAPSTIVSPPTPAPQYRPIEPSTYREIVPGPRAGYRKPLPVYPAPPPEHRGSFRCTVCF